MDGDKGSLLKKSRERRLRELERLYNQEFGTHVRFLALEVLRK